MKEQDKTIKEKETEKINDKKINKKKIILYIVGLAIVIYLLYTIYLLIKEPTNIVTVEEGKLYQEETDIGYVIRDEKVVKGENYKNGMEQIIAEGERASNNENIFRYYSANEESLKQKISELDAKIQEVMLNDKSLLTADIKLLENQIDEKLEDISKITDVRQAVQDILWFYRCGKIIENSNKEDYEERQEDAKQIYSYEFDDEYIFSAFMEQYGIDLNEIEYMHWWKFKSLFNSLNENTQFVKIMGYRNMNVSKIKDKEMKAHYKKMQKLYELPDMRTDEEKESDFANELW